MTETRTRIIWYCIARDICGFFCRLFFKITFYGKENVPEKGGVLLVCNHQSFLDPLFCGIRLKRPIHFLARDTLFTKPVLGRLITSVMAIPVRRGEADMGAMKKVIEKLKNGGMVCLFPEGTRTKDGTIADFKAGLSLLCRRGRATVVPVVIDGAFECWPRHKKIFSPGSKINVRYGKPITLEEVNQIGPRQLAANLTVKMRKMQNDCREKQGKEKFHYTE